MSSQLVAAELTRTLAAELSVAPTTGEANLITDFYGVLCHVAETFAAAPAPPVPAGTVVPGFTLPALTPEVREFFAAARARWQPCWQYRGQAITLLNLAGNPGTNTTKTFPSLLIVARAVQHIRQFGEPIIIVTPTSANKGVALRDAVDRAIATGLVTAEELRVVVVAPAQSAGKLRASRLSRDPELASLNPVALLSSPVAEQVKELGRQLIDQHAVEIHQRTGARLWYTLDLRNYLFADIARALFEQVVASVDAAARPRTHAHAVSSAFGMLGYHRGRTLLEEAGLSSPDRRPHTLLVQHLGTPDMVLHQQSGSFDRTAVPAYQLNAASGRYEQSTDSRFPLVTDDPAEVLDSTFYTHRPVTAPEMTGIINRFGGDGIVVSGRECRNRYPDHRADLARLGFAAPGDPGEVREWSLMMALTGVTNAIDRGLIKPDHDVLVHGSGWYTTADYEPLGAAAHPVSTPADVVRLICERPGPPA